MSAVTKPAAVDEYEMVNLAPELTGLPMTVQRINSRQFLDRLEKLPCPP